MYVWMDACMDVCMDGCMDVCMYVYFIYSWSKTI